MKKIFMLIAISAIIYKTNAQGCVAIRSNGATCTMTGSHETMGQPSRWTFGLNTRYFRSYKHFVGTEEQHERTEQGTEVINYNVSTDLGLTHTISSRWSLGLFVPVISNVRSSMYEHYGNTSKNPNARRNTRSFGLGDVRIAAYYWLANPAKMTKANVQLGLGLKLPTGDYRYQDYFWRNDSTKVLGPVDQSIQLGDGGTGISTEYNAYYRVGQAWNVYSNGFYLFNPREQNGVSTARGGVPSAANIAYGRDVMSVPDQFMVRVGAMYALEKFQFSGGLRIEGVPAKDLIGGSNGFRRPGYVVSAEPVVVYKPGKTQFYLSVPVAVERNRTQSVPDKIQTQKTGVFAQGDAAFADYSINFGVQIPLK